MINPFTTLTAGVSNRLTTGLANLNNPAGPVTTDISVLTEDTGDLETKIDKAIDQIGLLILIGQPHFVNQTPTAPQSGMKILFAIAIGENPEAWRDEAGLNPHCLDVVGYVTALLAQYPVAGYLPLRVMRADFFPDKKRQLYELSIETMTTVNPIP